MGSDRDSERYTAEYGNLLLEVSLLANEQERVFEYIVTDKTDKLVCWIGSAADLGTAQSDATFEAQTFLDPHVASPPAPHWQRDAEPGTSD